MTKLRNLPPAEVKKFIWIFYAVGLFGLGIPWTREIFITLIPANFLVAFVVLLITDKSDLKVLIPFSIAVFIISFAIEAIGVNTGMIFGDYQYGKSLGLRIFETPAVIGWNWLMLIYCTTLVAGQFTRNRYFISFLVAVLMVVYDFILERPAGYLDMWNWDRGLIPMQNFLAWFGISWIFAGVFQLLRPKLVNPVAATLFGVQLLFFFLLNIIFYFEKIILA